MTATPGPCGSCGATYGVCANELIEPCCDLCEHAVIPSADMPPLLNGEINEILGTFSDMLRGVLADGGRKRQAGTKPYWKVDPGHEAAQGRHRAAKARGELYDKDSGCLHDVHDAARSLMLAYQQYARDGLIPEDPR